jgi:hypothetical protein
VQHVLTAISSEGIMLTPVANLPKGLAGELRSILALLVYHYARGVLASHQIEAALRADSRLRLVCRDELPDWQQLRRFRRVNRSAVQNCLTRVLSEQRGPGTAVVSPSLEASYRLSEAAMLDELFADE